DPAATDRAAGIVTINPVNDAPVADDGHAVTDEDVPVRIDLRDFVHDVETAPDDLTYEIVDPPAARKGELVERIRNGVFLFRPADNFYGTAAFTFHVTDTGDPAGSGEAVLSSNDAVFRIRIRSVNDAPVAHAGRDVGGTTLPPADEGAVVEFHGRGEDVEDAPEALTYRWDFGDGNHADTAEATNTYADDGVYYATLTVIDTEGAVDTDTRMIVVNNVAPTATLSNSAPVDEGSGASVGFGAAFDPSASDTAAGFTYSFDFDNDGTFEVADGESPTADVPAALLAAGPAVRTVRARIADKDGGSTDYTTDVTVLNVAPSVSAGGDGAADEGGPFTRTGSFTDPGADAWAATVDYGDGSGAIALDLHADKTCTLQHTYADDGQYTVLVTMRDGDSASGDEVVVTVANVSPTAEITGAPEGDSPEGAAVAFGSAASDPAGPDDRRSSTGR